MTHVAAATEARVVLREALGAVREGRDLTREAAAGVMDALISGEAPPAQVGAFLTALAIKGETAAELCGMAESMCAHAVPLPHSIAGLVDTCGTGGGAIPTFNISTTAAFVVAGAGVKVAKHGNRAMSSACGSADVLEALGIPVRLTPAAALQCLEAANVAFLFAQEYHPAMRHVAPIRRELPYRTVFNCLGPLANPAGATAQVVGVYEPRLVPLLAGALLQLGRGSAMVVHGLDGLDELSTVGPTLVARVEGGEILSDELDSTSLGLPRAHPEALAPGENAAANAAITRSVLGGETGPRRDVVLLNAAAALRVAGAVASMQEGLQAAAAAIDSGAALRALEALRHAAREAAAS